MNTPSIWAVFKQAFMEGEKGSGKAFSAAGAMLIMGFHIAWQTVHDKPADMVLVVELIAFIVALYGVKMYQAVKTIQSDNSIKQIDVPKTTVS